MADLSKEEQLQEALIGWVLQGGSCEGLAQQLALFLEGLEEYETYEGGGVRAEAFARLRVAMDSVVYRAGKVDQAGSFQKLPPDVQQQATAEPAPVPVLIEIQDGSLVGVRAPESVQPSLWSYDEVREGCVPTALLDLPHRPVAVLREDPEQQDFPETILVRGQERHLLRVDGKVQYGRNGQPLYVSIPQ